jgi:hypothetical protein
MPAGCEFICVNEQCPNYNTGFAIKGVWPIGNIGLIINSSSVKQNPKFREMLIKIKDSGKKHACITLPNVDNVPVDGYRFNLWCESCNYIWDVDVFFTEEEQSKWDDKKLVPEEWFDNVVLSYECTKCKGHLKSFDTVIQEGIKCPSCKQDLKQSRWFSNERSE